MIVLLSKVLTVTMLQTLEFVDSFAIEGAHSNYVTDTRVCWLHSLFCINDDLLYFA